MVKEFPDKILLVKDNIDDVVQDYWVLRNLTQYKDSEYIRKDIVDDMLKTAEDHAYFAGSEAMREKLIEKACEWLENNLEREISIITGGYVHINFGSVIKKFREYFKEE